MRVKSAFVKKHILISLLLLLSAVMINFAFVYGEVSSVTGQNSIIETEDNISVYYNKKTDGDNRNGLLVTANKSGSQFDFTDAMRGAFSLEYKILTGNSSLDKITVKISAKSGSFEFVSKLDGSGNISAYLSENGNILSDAVSVSGNGLILYFNPVSGKFSINSSVIETVLSDSVNSYEDYNVSVVFGNFSGNASVLLYSLSGQSISSLNPVNNAGASIYIKNPEFNAVTGEKYTVNKAKFYDALDKTNVTDKGVTVIGPDGGVVGFDASDYSFTPLISGRYKLLYSAEDSGDIVTCEQLIITAADSVEKAEISVSNDFFDENNGIILGKGTGFEFPSAEALSSYVFSGYIPVKLAVTSSGITDTFSADGKITYSFDKVGVYTVKYFTDTDNQDLYSEAIYNINIADIPVFTDANVSDTYYRNYILTIPEVSAVYGNDKYDVTHTLTKPSGETASGQNIKLDYIGVYRLKYYFVYKTNTYYTEKYFSVVTKAQSLFDNIRGTSVTGNTDAPDYAKKQNGIEITATRGNATSEYTNVIDFSGKTKNDLLLEFLITPKEQGTRDFNSLTITFFDKYDSNNKITLYIAADATEGYYWLSNAYASSGKNSLYGNNWGVIRGINGKGAQPSSGFYGTGYDGNLIDTMKIYFDYQEKAFYSYFKSSLIKILDLDDSTNVGAGNEWNGFKTGEAYMDITFSGAGSILVTDVDGQTMSGEDIKSVSTPEITVKVDEDDIPEALVNKPYRLFDSYVETKLNNISYDDIIKVYLNYNDPLLRKEYGIDNGYFTPDSTGIYTIVYTAVTAGGEYAKTVNVTAVNEIENLQLTFSNADKLFFESNFKLGSTAVLPEGSVSGGSGDKTLKIFYKRNNEDYKLIENGIFSPVFGGLYTLKYSVTDYLGNELVTEKNLFVTSSFAPMFLDELNINNGVMLSGKTYIMPQYNAYQFYDNGVKTEVTPVITVNLNGKTTVIGKDGKFTPAADNDRDTAVITYRAVSLRNATYYAEKSFSVVIIKPVDFSEYFYSEIKGNTELLSSGIEYQIDGKKEMKFVNKLSSANFFINFKFSDADSFLNGITLTLTDSGDITNSVSISLYRKSDSLVDIYINGIYSKTVSGAFAKTEWYVAYNALTNSFVNSAGGIYSKIDNNISGEAFNGFESGSVYLNIETEGENGKGKLLINYLSGQFLNDNRYDFTNPNITFNDEIIKSATLGSVYTVPKAIVSDVIDPDAYCLVTVKDPTGATIINGLSSEISYNVNIEKCGVYTINYIAKDSDGNTSKRYYNVYVSDTVAPVIKINGKIGGDAKLGSTVELPSADVTDNLDNGLSVKIYVINPNGFMTLLKGNSFKAELEGIYRIVYYAQDSYFNYSQTVYEINIK